MRDRPAGVPHQVVQQLEFFWCQAQTRAGLAHGPAGWIQFDIANDDRRTHVPISPRIAGSVLERRTADRRRAANSGTEKGFVM